MRPFPWFTMLALLVVVPAGSATDGTGTCHDPRVMSNPQPGQVGATQPVLEFVHLGYMSKVTYLFVPIEGDAVLTVNRERFPDPGCDVICIIAAEAGAVGRCEAGGWGFYDVRVDAMPRSAHDVSFVIVAMCADGAYTMLC